MKDKKPAKRIITSETHQLTIIRPRAKRVRAWCEGCAAETEMALPEIAAELLGISPREVYRRVEGGSIHFIEIEGGKLLICCRQAGEG
jgi:hypothetical protein